MKRSRHDVSGRAILGRLGRIGQRCLSQTFRVCAHHFELLRRAVEQERHARLVRPHLKCERAVGDEVIAARPCGLSIDLIVRRAHTLYRDRIVERLTRQKRDEALRAAFRLVILIEQKDELMPEQILQHHRRFGLKLLVGLTGFV